MADAYICSLKGSSLWLLLIVTLVVGSQTWGVEAATCGSYISQLNKCQSFVLGFTSTLDQACCAQVRQLNAQTLNNRPLRQQICSCFAGYMGNGFLNAGHVTALPGLCKVNLGFKISNDPTLCQRV